MSEGEKTFMDRVVSGEFDELIDDAKKKLIGEDYDLLLEVAALLIVQKKIAEQNDELCAKAIEKLFGITDENLSKARKSFDDLASSIPEIVREARARQREETAKSGAAAKLANDPRRAEKQFIRDCWQDWRDGKTEYKSKAAFARDMIQKCEHLTSIKKVEDWCREWEKEHPLS